MFEISFSFTGQTEVHPNIIKITTSANYATVTSAGWLSQENLSPNSVNPLDIIFMEYGYNENANPKATFGVFQPVITNGVITLYGAAGTGSVILPVINGDIPVFSGTTGAISDSGVSFTNAALGKVANAAAGGYVAGQMIVSNGTDGSIRSGLGISAFQINSPSSATPAGATAITIGLQLPASSITSGSAAGLTSIMDFVANAGADLSAHSAKTSATGALGATSITSASRSELILNANVMTTGAILAGHYININAASGVTGGTDDYCAQYINGPQAGSLGALFSFNGRAGNLFHIEDGGAMVTTPAGATPSGTLKALLIDIGGTVYQLLLSTILS